MIAPPKPPAHDELEALIKEARERQLRRRLLGAASIAIAAAIGLGVYALATGGKVDNVSQPSAPGGRAGIPSCGSSRLAMSIGGQAATQMVLGGALIKNTGGAACSLPTGRPIVGTASRCESGSRFRGPATSSRGRPHTYSRQARRPSSPCDGRIGAASGCPVSPRFGCSSVTD